MSVAIRALESPTPAASPAPEGQAGHGPYLRSFRTQPRRRVRPRLIAFLLVAAALLFLQVWERTAANSLSMERDRLSREVRSLENRIRITRDLQEQAAFQSGIDISSLGRSGFLNPDPSQVVDIDLSMSIPRRAASPALGARLFGLVRRALPRSWAERIVGLPTAPVEAQGSR
jgi:hypothetical protein